MYIIFTESYDHSGLLSGILTGGRRIYRQSAVCRRKPPKSRKSRARDAGSNGKTKIIKTEDSCNEQRNFIP